MSSSSPYRLNKPTHTVPADQPCWNCGENEFTNSNSSHHMRKQLICTACYEPQEDDEEYEDEDLW